MMRLMSCVMAFGLGVAAPVMAQDAKAGEKLFTDQVLLCHSIAGKECEGSLDDVGSKLKADEIRAWITDSKAMTAKVKPERNPMKVRLARPTSIHSAYLTTLKKK
jgi:hypothetical protein